MRSKSLVTIILVIALLAGFLYIILTNRPINKLQNDGDTQTQTETTQPETVQPEANPAIEDSANSVPSEITNSEVSNANEDTPITPPAKNDDSKVDSIPAETTPSADAPSTESTSGGYTLSDVAKHASESDCWTAINNSVYDLTSWISRHPGGPGPIKGLCGIDGSSGFQKMHGGSKTAQASLALLKIGDLN